MPTRFTKKYGKEKAKRRRNVANDENSSKNSKNQWQITKPSRLRSTWLIISILLQLLSKTRTGYGITIMDVTPQS